MKKLVLPFIFAVALLLSCTNDNKTEVKLVSAEEMNQIIEMEDVQLVDVRTENEHNEESIEGAQNININSPTFDDDISKLDKSKPVILYCKKGGRSAKCASKLRQAGFKKIYDLEGGITKWKYKGYKVKRRS